jgi:protein-tyrosine phosphatase
MKKNNQTRILFVCMGNICRSPMAEAVFAQMVADEQMSERFLIDSCGTGHWHVGEMAHSDTRRVLQENGALWPLTGKHARQLTADDLSRFDYILAMDDDNLRGIQNLMPAANLSVNHAPVVQLLRDFDPIGTGSGVPDPYYDSARGFENVYLIIHRSCTGLLKSILNDGQ